MCPLLWPDAAGITLFPMITRMRRAAAVAAALSLVLLPLSACSSATEEDPVVAEEPGDEPADDGADDEGDEGSSGEMFGCTDGILAYISDKGYPSAEPLDPAGIEIPDADFAEVPDCYVVDDYGGSPRYAAFWATDPQGVLATLGAALDAGGWEQSDDYGPLVWWKNGDDPTAAEHSLSAAPQPIDGVETLWASW